MAKPKVDIAAARQSLQDTKDRRTTTFRSVEYDVEEEAPKVQRVWDITCPEQVTQLANDNPGHFWEWLCGIVAERDNFRVHTQSLDAVHKQYKDLEARLEEVIAENQQAEAALTAATEQKSKWRTKAFELEQQVDQLDSASLARDQSRTSSKKSAKQPDPPLFVDGIDPTWDDWSSKIREKMRVNADHFSTEDARVVYVLGRLGGQAVTYTYHRREKGTTNPYIAYEEVLDELAETYEDTDRLENARRDLMKLQMLDRPFKGFIADFLRLGHASRLTEDHLIQLLREKLPPRLKKPMLAQNAVVPFGSFKDLKDYLVRLDNSHLHDLPARTKPSKTTTVQTTRSIDKKVTTAPPSRKSGTTRVPVCYNCGEVGHFKGDKTKCKEDHQTPKGKAAQDAAVSEIQIADMEDVADDSPAESSDSGNE